MIIDLCSILGSLQYVDIFVVSTSAFHNAFTNDLYTRIILLCYTCNAQCSKEIYYILQCNLGTS